MVEKTLTKTGVNGNSIISLTTGILSLFIPFLSLVLGIFGIITARKAIREIKHTSEDGRGLAMAGLICSIVGVVLQLFMLIGVAAIYFN